MDLEKLIEKRYASKHGKDILLRLIETKMNEGLGIPVPEITPGIASGKEEELRRNYKRALSNPLLRISKKQTSMRDRVNIFNKYMYPERFGEKDFTLEEFMATFIFMQEFEKIIREYDPYDPKMAGMRFEMLATVLLDGIELFGVGITDSVIAGENFSMKFIAERQWGKKHPIIEGSLYNLLEMLKKGERVIYFLCLKRHPNYFFRAFYLTEDNFINALNMDGAQFRSLINYGALELSRDDFLELREAGIDIREDDKTLYRPGIIESFKGNGKLLAKYLQRCLKGNLKAVPLLSPELSTFIMDIKGVAEYFNGNPDKGDPVACSNQGTLVISQDILEKVKEGYRESMYSKIFDFFENSERLVNDFRDFFASSSKSSTATSIIKDIDYLKEDFKNISTDMMSKGMMEIEDIEKL